jgi:MFS family permease
MQMWSIGDWFSLITLLLSFPLAVAGTLFAPRLLRFLENRKLIKTNKSKQQALQHYQHIKALHEGRRDKNAFYILLLGLSVLSAIAASTILISTFIFAPVGNLLFLLLVLAFALAFMSVIFLAAMYETSRRIDQFDRYKAEIEEQWGPLD